MLLKQVLDVYEYIDSATANGQEMKEYMESLGAKDVEVKTIAGNKGETDFIRIRIHGSKGKSKGMGAPTLRVLGRLGGIGARPEMIGMVSDADGAVVALAVAAKLSVVFPITTQDITPYGNDVYHLNSILQL